VPCLHGLDTDGRVIYVGSFSKTLFPALRLGFLIVPADLREPLLAARRAADVVTSLSAYYLQRPRGINGLVLGFGAVGPDGIRSGMERLAASIEAANRPVRSAKAVALHPRRGLPPETAGARRL
jgi:DNA-binding transcriptional MocR family regulator